MTEAAGSGGRLRGARGVQVAAQAKVNLRLRILAREAGGYHQIETIFLRLELADVVRVRRSRTRSLDVTGDAAAAVGPVEQNLAWRALETYAEATGTNEGFAIELGKHIPVGGGLGGGSADAGAVLRGLDALSASPLGEGALLRLAAGLGADVPFLTSTHPCALGWGRGERLFPLAAPPARTVALLVPSFGVSTAEAYGWVGGTGGRTGGDASVLDPASLASWQGLSLAAINDFETVVASHHPVLAAMVDALRAAGCEPAMLSGSGAVVFGVLPAGSTRLPTTLREPCVTLITRSATRVEPVSALD